ncbi:unnamed protein product [Effrenium voratum]|nr:unnamed protein product [Effrenium voratum]CAJ1438918.1 unnamed protein product [Effrenium voratum]
MAAAPTKSSATMEAAFRYLAEEIRQEMRAEMMKVVEKAASSCASICMDRMQALRAELLSEVEAVEEATGDNKCAAHEVRRRTSFYELFSTDDSDAQDSADNEDDLAKVYDHLEKCARRRSVGSVGSVALPNMSGLLLPPVTEEPDKSSSSAEETAKKDVAASAKPRRLSQSTEEPLIALDDFLQAAKSPRKEVLAAPQDAQQVRDVEDRLAWLEFFLYPAAAPIAKSALSVQQRMQLLDGHLWGREAELFEVLALPQRVLIAERALMGGS